MNILEEYIRYIRELERIIRCSLRTFDKHLNTPETRTIKRAVKRLEIMR